MSPTLAVPPTIPAPFVGDIPRIPAIGEGLKPVNNIQPYRPAPYSAPPPIVNVPGAVPAAAATGGTLSGLGLLLIPPIVIGGFIAGTAKGTSEGGIPSRLLPRDPRFSPDIPGSYPGAPRSPQKGKLPPQGLPGYTYELKALARFGDPVYLEQVVTVNVVGRYGDISITKVGGTVYADIEAGLGTVNGSYKQNIATASGGQNPTLSARLQSARETGRPPQGASPAPPEAPPARPYTPSPVKPPGTPGPKPANVPKPFTRPAPKTPEPVTPPSTPPPGPKPTNVPKPFRRPGQNPTPKPDRRIPPPGTPFSDPPVPKTPAPDRVPSPPTPGTQPTPKTPPSPTPQTPKPSEPFRIPGPLANPFDSPQTEPPTIPKTDPNSTPETTPETNPRPKTDPFEETSPDKNPKRLPPPPSPPQTDPNPKIDPNKTPNPNPPYLPPPPVRPPNCPPCPPQIKPPDIVNKCPDPCIETPQVSITVNKFVGCFVVQGVPKYFIPTTLMVPAPQAAAITLSLNNQADILALQCRDNDAIAAVPDWWQVRLGADRPQLIVQYARKNSDGTFDKAKYIVSIPHWWKSKDQTVESDFPTISKGQYQGTLIFLDNSKIIVNCLNEVEAQRVVTKLSSNIKPIDLEGSIYTRSFRRGRELNEVIIFPRIAKFFATGQRNMIPTWVKKLN